VKENKPDHSIFWVSALSEKSFKQAYAEIAKTLPIPKSTIDEDILDSVRRYLSSEAAGPWLLIVDNADDQGMMMGNEEMTIGIDSYLPMSDKGRILFTTRLRKIALEFAGINMIVLNEMSPHEAESFLEKSLYRKDLLHDGVAVTKLLQELTYLPLAITQAAAYLNQNPISITKYLSLLLGTEQSVIGLMSRQFHDSTRYKGSQNAVATTWLVSFDQIRESDSVAAEILSFISCIEPKAIPESLLPGLDSPEQFVNAIGILCGYSFLVKRGEEGLFDMHSLVHLASRIWIEKEGLKSQTTEKAIRHLAVKFPNNRWENRHLWRAYLPHAFRMLYMEEGVNIVEKYTLLILVGRCLQADGRIKEATRCIEEYHDWCSSYFPKDHPKLLVAQDDLAAICYHNGNIQKSIELLEQIVAVRAKLAEDDLNHLYSQHWLAAAYIVNGQVKEAIKLLEHIVISKATLSKDDPQRLASQYELARVYLADGQVEKAIKLFQHIVTIQEISLAETHPVQLASQHGLARAYLADGQIKKAVKLFQYVVIIQEISLAETHPRRLISQYGLARAYFADGQVEKAVKLFQHIVTIQEISLAETHPDRLISQHELARAYLADGQVEKAVKLFEHIVTIREISLAETHPDRLALQYKLAQAYLANGQVKKAVELFEHVATIQEISLAETHPDRLASQHGLAQAYLADGQIKKAVELFEHIITIREISLAEIHSDRLNLQRWLASAYIANR